jgi:glycosyltransferase involved in cell wall biosynthesis
VRIFIFFLYSIKRIVKSILPREIYDRLRDKLYKFLFWCKRKFKKNNKLVNRYPKKLNGVNLFIHKKMKTSAGVEGRLLQQMLENSGILYQTIDLQDPQYVKKMNIELYSVNLIVCHVGTPIQSYLLQAGIDLNKHYNIGYMAWELAVLPDALLSILSPFQEVWGFSSFVTNSIEKKSLGPVITVPLCSDQDKTVIENGREYFGIDKDVFLFMCAYDCTSYVSRKNPQAVVQAFLRAFSPEDRHVGLILKLTYPENFKEHIEELLESLSPFSHIYCIDKYLSDIEMRTLIHISDAVVSLHRSEGFGLVPLEAMALGTPVISTAWSGNMDYMNHMNTALVGYRMIPVNGEYFGSTPGDGLVWADPDIDEAAAHMRRIVSDKDWREKLIANGIYTANECFNVKTMSKIMRDRLEFLEMI